MGGAHPVYCLFGLALAAIGPRPRAPAHAAGLAVFHPQRLRFHSGCQRRCHRHCPGARGRARPRQCLHARRLAGRLGRGRGCVGQYAARRRFWRGGPHAVTHAAGFHGAHVFYQARAHRPPAPQLWPGAPPRAANPGGRARRRQPLAKLAFWRAVARHYRKAQPAGLRHHRARVHGRFAVWAMPSASTSSTPCTGPMPSCLPCKAPGLSCSPSACSWAAVCSPTALAQRGSSAGFSSP